MQRWCNIHRSLILITHFITPKSPLIFLVISHQPSSFELNFLIKYKDFLSPLLTLRPKYSKNIHTRGKGKQKIER